MPEIVMFDGHHDYEFIPHAHEVTTVILVTAGGVQIEVDDARYAVKAGDLVVIGPHQVHSARPLSSGGWTMRSLHAPPRLFMPHQRSDESDRAVRFAAPVLSGDSQAAALFCDLHRHSTSWSDADRQRGQIATFLAWFQSRPEIFQPTLVAAPKFDAILETAHEQMVRAAFDSTQINSIAEEVGISTYSLIRRFRRTYGISPHAWRMQIRANEAAKLLGDGLHSVDVAASCGFSDQAHMTRVFKRVFGVTPGQYGHARRSETTAS